MTPVTQAVLTASATYSSLEVIGTKGQRSAGEVRGDVFNLGFIETIREMREA